MSETARLKLKLLEQSQANKEITVNESLNLLDFFCQAIIKGKVKTPPTEKTEGDAYLIDVSPSGEFAAKKNQIAVYNNGAWLYIEPFEGLRIYDFSEDKGYIYKNETWLLEGIYARVEVLETAVNALTSA